MKQLNTISRPKRSPRAPSIPLREAIERASAVYGKEGRHSVSADVFAADLGYTSASNGSAASTIASLRYYGLIERPMDGALAVSKELEKYIHAPEEGMRRSLRLQWLGRPPVFQGLLEKYRPQARLPSDAQVKFDLIEMGFHATSAEECVRVFTQSVEFAQFFDDGLEEGPAEAQESETVAAAAAAGIADGRLPDVVPRAGSGGLASDDRTSDGSIDQIPVRLPGGRRAWLVIPQPFYESDKQRLKAQIDLLLADDSAAD